jgi:hypothetical protein
MKNLFVLASLCLASGAIVATAPLAQAAPAKTSIVGKWMVTSVSATSYTNTTTGAITGGTGGAQIYTFSPNGRYTLHSYLKVGAYGQETESYTWKQGTYALSGGNVTLKETSGKYQIKSNYAGGRNYTRPAKGSDLKTEKKAWKVAMDNGKPVLMLGNGSAAVAYKKQ